MILRPSSMSNRHRAARIRPSAMWWRRDFGAFRAIDRKRKSNLVMAGPDELIDRVPQSPQPLIPGVGGLGGGGLFGFGIALRAGDDDHAASRHLMTGIGRHLVEEIRRNRRDDRDHD